MNRKEETKAFREWLEAWLMPSEFSPGYLYKLDDDGEYAIDFVRTAWEAWEARAALRASAAPEEGIEDDLGLFELGRSFLEEYERYFSEGAFPNFICADSPVEIIVHLINERDEALAALPSDSGKAEPVVAWLVQREKTKELVFFGQQATWAKERGATITPLYAALAPATEGGTVTQPSASREDAAQ